MAFITPFRIMLSIWMLLVTFGFTLVLRYQMKPGPLGIPDSQVSGRINPSTPDSRSWKLTVFLHPECTCSRASLEELGRLQRELGAQMEISIYVSTQLSHEQTLQSTLYQKAIRNTNWTVTLDPEARIASAMKAYTSGACFLFHPDGQLVFAGGVTASRGHEGPAAGQQTIRNAVLSSNTTTPLAQSPVYGCGILDANPTI